jgi:uncharacterized membrane protein YkvI
LGYLIHFGSSLSPDLRAKLAITSFTAYNTVLECLWRFETASVDLINADIAGLILAFLAIMDKLSLLGLAASMANTSQPFTEYFSPFSTVGEPPEEFSNVLIT